MLQGSLKLTETINFCDPIAEEDSITDKSISKITLETTPEKCIGKYINKVDDAHIFPRHLSNLN